MSVFRSYNHVNRHLIDRAKAWGNHRCFTLFFGEVWIVLLIAVTHRDLVVPLTALEGLRLSFLRFDSVSFYFTPFRAQVGTNVFDVLLPVRAIDHVYTKLAVRSIGIHILLVSPRLKIYAWSYGHKLIHIASIVDLFNVSQAIEHLGGAHRISKIVYLRSACFFHN